MASEFHRNAERYYDPIAGAALVNVEKGERMNWKVGDIITATRQGNPVEKKLLVLANDGYVLTGLILFAREMSNCIPVMCGTQMYANPYRLDHVSLRTNDIQLNRTASDEELTAAQDAVRKAFGFEYDHAEQEEDEGSELADLAEAQAKELIEAPTRAAVYQELYENLLKRCLPA